MLYNEHQNHYFSANLKDKRLAIRIHGIGYLFGYHNFCFLQFNFFPILIDIMPSAWVYFKSSIHNNNPRYLFAWIFNLTCHLDLGFSLSFSTPLGLNSRWTFVIRHFRKATKMAFSGASPCRLQILLPFSNQELDHKIFGKLLVDHLVVATGTQFRLSLNSSQSFRVYLSVWNGNKRDIDKRRITSCPIKLTRRVCLVTDVQTRNPILWVKKKKKKKKKKNHQPGRKQIPPTFFFVFT